MKEAQRIDGKKISIEILGDLQRKITDVQKTYNIKPRLHVIMLGNDPVSSLYVSNKVKAAGKVGIDAEVNRFDDSVTTEFLVNEIHKMNMDKNISGIIVQLPLPKHINQVQVMNTISVAKDVDGLNSINIGNLFRGEQLGLIPCTPQACIYLMKKYIVNLVGKKVVIIGRSNIVGRPLFALLLQENCTVTLCHSYTRNLKQIVKLSDIVISAVGSPHFLKYDYFSSKTQMIIDVGISTIYKNKRRHFAGDVDYTHMEKYQGYFTPVPGGVGPITVSYLLNNTFVAMCMQNDLHKELYVPF